MGDNRPPRYVERDAAGTPTRVVYRASGIGGCPRALVAAGCGVTPEPHPEWFQNVLDEGTEAEASIIALYEASEGVEIGGSQDAFEVWLFDTEIEGVEVPVIARAAVDGWYMRQGSGGAPDYPVVVEAKKFRPSTWPKFRTAGVEINVLYPWQVSVIMHAAAKKFGEVVEVHMVGGRYVLDGDGDGVGSEWVMKPGGKVVEVEVKVVTNPPVPLKAIRKRLLGIEELLAQGVQPTDAAAECKEDRYPCGYWRLHDSALTGEKPVKVKGARGGGAGGKAGGGKLLTSYNFKLTTETDAMKEVVRRVSAAGAEVAELEARVRAVRKGLDDDKKALLDWVASRGVTPLADKGSLVGQVDGAVVVVETWERAGYEVKASGGVRVAIRNEDNNGKDTK